MPKKTFILFVTAIVFFISCKNEPTGARVNEPAGNKRFKIEIDVIAEKDDAISLYYTNDGSINFGKIEPIVNNIKGSTAIQKVVYELPRDIVDPQIRLDFGNNPEQEKVILNRVAISYGDKILIVEGRHIFNYFRPDPTKCEVHLDENAIVPKTYKGVKQAPSLYPHPEILAREISKLTANN